MGLIGPVADPMDLNRYLRGAGWFIVRSENSSGVYFLHSSTQRRYPIEYPVIANLPELRNLAIQLARRTHRSFFTPLHYRLRRGFLR